MTSNLKYARTQFDNAKAQLHTAVLAELAAKNLGLFWVAEETEIFIAASAEAIRAAGLAQTGDDIQAIQQPSEELMAEVLDFMEIAAPTLLEQPCQIWTAYQ